MQSQNPSSSKTWIKTSMNLPKYPNKKLHNTPSNSKKDIGTYKIHTFLHQKSQICPPFLVQDFPVLPRRAMEFSGVHGLAVFRAPPRSLQFSRCSKPSIHSREDAAGLGFTGKSPWLKKKHLTFEI